MNTLKTDIDNYIKKYYKIAPELTCDDFDRTNHQRMLRFFGEQVKYSLTQDRYDEAKRIYKLLKCRR